MRRPERAPQRVVFWVAAACLVLGAASLAFHAEPSYDAWAWLIWGREVAHGDLSTLTGPSWKPLPVAITTVLSVFGGAAPTLWTVVARAAGFGAVAMGALLAHRLAGRIAALIAAMILLTATWLWDFVLLANSEGLLVLLVFAAAERCIQRRHGQAFALGVGAALLRPEAWPFLGLYGLWLMWTDRGRARWVLGGGAVVLALWLLPELWGSGDLWRAADRARDRAPDAPANAARPSVQVVRNAASMTPTITALGVLLALVGLVARRVPESVRKPAWGVAFLAAGWLALVALMTEFGFSGIDRYIVTPVALACVLAAAGLAWTIDLAGSVSFGRALVAVVALIVLAGVVRGARDWPRMTRETARQAAVMRNLDDAIDKAGGKRALERCGPLFTSFYLTPNVAWDFDRHLKDVSNGARPPGVVLRTQFWPDLPVDPPAGVFSHASNDRIAAQTAHWQVETACR